MASPKKRRKPGGGRPKGAEPAKEMVAAFRATTTFGEWFVGLVIHARRHYGFPSISKTDVIIRALKAFAREIKYAEEAPDE